MHRFHTKAGSRKGFLTLEAVIGMTLLLVLVLGLLQLAMGVRAQRSVEEAASLIVWNAAHSGVKAGTTQRKVVLEGRAAASICWGESFVKVRVEANRGRAVAERLLPRGVM